MPGFDRLSQLTTGYLHSLTATMGQPVIVPHYKDGDGVWHRLGVGGIPPPHAVGPVVIGITLYRLALLQPGPAVQVLPGLNLNVTVPLDIRREVHTLLQMTASINQRRRLLETHRVRESILTRRANDLVKHYKKRADTKRAELGENINLVPTVLVFVFGNGRIAPGTKGARK